MKKNASKSENLDLNFWGFRLNSQNPGPKTFLLLLMLLVFFTVLVILLKTWVLSLAGILGSKLTAKTLITWIRTRSP